MRFLLLFTILFSLFTITSAQNSSALIPWAENKPLAWENFKGKPNKIISYKALTAAGISFNINFDGITLTVKTATTFDPKRSWTKDKEDEALLSHEQFHFNLTELHARMFRKKIMNTTFKSEGKKLVKEVMSYYEDEMKALSKHQKKYDDETKHSLNKKEQLKWENQITKEIAALSDYSESDISITMENH